MKIPQHSPIVLRQKTLLPKDMEEVQVGTLPTHLISNTRHKKGYIHANANGRWLTSNATWLPDTPVKTNSLFNISASGTVILTGQVIPKKGAEPEKFYGVQIEGWQGNNIFPKFALFKSEDCLELHPGEAEFHKDYKKFPFLLDDPRIELVQLRDEIIGFNVIGKLTSKEWELLDLFPLPGMGNPYSRAQVIYKSTSNSNIILAGNMLKEVTPTLYNPTTKNYEIQRVEVLKLPDAKRSLILEPSPLLPKDSDIKELVTLHSWYGNREERVTIDLSLAIHNGFKCSELYWPNPYTIEVKPECITAWPQIPIACKARGKDGFICEELQINYNVWERSDLKKDASHIFVTKGNKGIKCFGLEKTLEKDALQAKKDQVELTLGNNYAEKFDKFLGSPPDSVEQLDRYMIVANLLKTGDYIKISGLGTLCEWIFAAIKSKQIYHNYGIVSKTEAKNALNQLPEFKETTILALLLYSGKVTKKDLINSLNPKILEFFKDIDLTI